MKELNIKIQEMSKIEGHASLEVKVRNDEVEEVKLGFTESKRFFTEAIEGASIDTLAQSVSRICGTCSIAHMLCSIEAIEKAMEIKVSKQTMLLKKLTMNGLMIRDHALHLYLFSLPDVFGKDSVLDFKGKEEKYLKDSFDVKRAGNNLSIAVAGRAVHPPYPQVGGFASIPKKEELDKCLVELRIARSKVIDLMEVYSKSKIDYTRKTKFIALCGEFNFLEGPIKTSSGEKIEEKDYFEYLHKIVLPYSTSVGYKFEGETFMLGALARLNLNRKALNKKTLKDANKYLKVFPSNNIFHNNLAQAIEILHAIDSSVEIIENNKFAAEEPIKFEKKEGEGIGVIEAPRGILIHKISVDKNGNVIEGRIVTPTQQNQINIELDIKELVQKNLFKLSKAEIEYEIEKLIRAYDPCISCATHFLKVNWS